MSYYELCVSLAFLIMLRERFERLPKPKECNHLKQFRDNFAYMLSKLKIGWVQSVDLVHSTKKFGLIPN